MSPVAPGRVDQLALGCTRAALNHCGKNLGLTQEQLDAMWPNLEPAVTKLIKHHLTAQPVTLESFLQKLGALPADKESEI